MALRARDVMSSRVITVRPEDPLTAAISRMTGYSFSALPVVNRNFRLAGIISLLDVLRHREDGGDDTATVGEVMNPDVLSMPPGASVGLLAHRMRTYGELRVLPIVQRGQLIGVVTRSDLLRERTPQTGRLGRFSRTLPEDVRELLPAPSGGRTPPPDATHVRDIMTAEVSTADAADRVQDVAARLVRHRFTLLPVVDARRRLLGVVSEADLLGREPLAGRSGPSATVASVMTRQVTTLGPDDTVAHARLLVAEHGLRVVPVVSDGVLVGVLSRRDLL